MGLLIHARSVERDALAEPLQSRRVELQDRASVRRVAGYVAGGLSLTVIGAGAVKLAIHREEGGSTLVSLAGRF